jgi:Fe-S cluster biosynthesis and repair protein YggX
MAEIECKRCGASGEGMAAAPLPGEAGRLVQEGTCPDCWEIWKGEQVKLINEHGLSPGEPEHYALLVDHMKKFLQL